MQPTQFHIQSDGQRMRRLADALHLAMARCGYVLVETPVIQSADLFLTKAGDQIVSKLFTFERHSQQLALRPEFTATAAQDYVDESGGEQPIVRWQFSGPIFEDDFGYAATHYQRFSIGAELIGLGGLLAESEIISMAAQSLAAQGLQGWRLVIGHAGLMRLLLARFDLDPRTQRFLLSQLQTLKHPDYGRAYVLERLDKLVLGREADGEPMVLQAVGDSSTEFNTQQILSALLDATQRNVTMGGRSRHDIVRRLLQKRQRATEQHQITDALDFLEQWAQISAAPPEAFATIRSLIGPDDAEAQAMLADWEQVIDLLGAYNIPVERIRIQPDLARSWDYYTGIVFELYSENGLHLAGGGRYDELIRLVGGQRDVPAVGFVYYPDQILAALSTPERAANTTITIAVDRETQVAGIHWAQTLRSRDVPVVLMPADRAAESSGEVLTVAADGGIRHGGKTYSVSDLDLLMNDLKRA